MAQEPIITVSEGQLKGKLVTDFYGGLQYYSFQGIPYAKPPIGKLRFKAPQPAEPWTGIREATSEGSACYSRHLIFGHLMGSEDCLFLNVYIPQLPTSTNTPNPVMVSIHGGAFMAGSGNTDFFGPDFLLPHDVIVVTINYRVGLLGFLSLEDPSLEIPGNAGLKDQVLALKWVQKNIFKFGGDANNVTIFGESTGAASVHYLMLSPMAKGLFHKAILQSGTAINCWARGQKLGVAIARALKRPNIDEKEILKILMELPVEEIFKIQSKIPNPIIASEVRSFGPVIEKTSKESSFLAEEPIDIITSGRYNKVPLMIGFTSREGMALAALSKIQCGEVLLPTEFETSVPHTMKCSKGSDKYKTIYENIKKFYFGEVEPSLSNIDQYYMLQTDNFFLRSIHTTVKLHNATSTTPIYFYRMSVQSTLNIYKKFYEITDSGVSHFDDIGCSELF